jgi:para-nitrobenzyl esterase
MKIGTSLRRLPRASTARACRSLSALLAVVCVGVGHAQVLERPIPGDPVTIDNGRVSGTLLRAGVRAYLGVPFAAPPVRERRWQPPAPAEKWSGVRYALRAAPECIQTLRSHDINHYFGEEATSEDCLYLNIWAPTTATPSARKPVLVWIYGGGFTVGSASMANYSGEVLAAKGIVYVSIAYRLGALGFMAHPELTAESRGHASANWGFLDQVAALEWIQQNIAQFGGDPANVTIMGQSAGSMAVSLLQASPLARGLFHRAVGMSGASFATGDAGGVQPLGAAEEGGLRLQRELEAASLAKMRGLSADRILQAQLAIPQRYGPVIDAHFLSQTPAEIFASGQQSDVPIMIGFTRDESFSELARAATLEQYRGAAERLYGAASRKLLELYPAVDDASARRAATDAARDSSVALQMHRWAFAQTATGEAPVYGYLFSRVHPYVPGITFSDHDPRTVGAYHTADVPYWLGTLESLNLFRKTREWGDADRALAELMSGALVAFATSGDPNRAGAADDWPRYTPQREEMIELGETTRRIEWPNRAKLDFFAANPPHPPAARTGARD